MNINENLSWDDKVGLFGESVLTTNGYTARMHSSESCTNRLDNDVTLQFRSVNWIAASSLCTECTSEIVKTSISTTVIALRDLSRTLARVTDNEEIRSTVVTIRKNATEMTSIHPDFDELLLAVLEEAERVIDTLPVHY